jgi:lysophospholipase L1-like esterase
MSSFRLPGSVSACLTLLCALAWAATSLSAQNEPVDPSTYGHRVKVACVGDSITAGGGAQPGFSYPEQLGRLLGKDWEVLNCGNSGSTLLSEGNKPYIRQKEYADALASRPDLVIIMLGTNDTKPVNWEKKRGFKKDYQSLIQSFRALESKPRIYICRPVPVFANGNFGINEHNLEKVLDLVDEIAREENTGLIDMHKALEKQDALFPDHVHPNNDGAGLMAAAAFQALTGKTQP